MKKLDDIRFEVGPVLFKQMMRKAEMNLASTAYQFGDSRARRAFMYTEVLHQYNEYTQQEEEKYGALKRASATR